MAIRKIRKKKQKRQLKEKSVENFLNMLDKQFQARQNNPNPPFPYDRKTNLIKLPQKINEELTALLRKGSKIEAIKRVTKLTGAGLRVSKDYVDVMLREM